jgi:hypothetical protein
MKTDGGLKCDKTLLSSLFREVVEINDNDENIDVWIL